VLARGAALLLSFALVAALLPGSGSVAAAPLTSGGFTTSATATSASYASGETASITVRVTSSTTRVARVFVDLYSPTAAMLNQVSFDNQSFTAGVERTFPVTWPIPGAATAGGYSVEVRVYDPSLPQPKHYNDSAAFFTVGMSASWPAGGPVRILPLGDSLTDGYVFEGGYRIDLRAMLLAAHHDIDFVGSRYSGPLGLGDKNHEGHVGWRIDELTGGAGPWLRAYQPRVVLLLVGTQDMLQGYDPTGAPGRLGTLLDTIKTTLPDVRVVLSTLPRVADADALVRIQTFNAALPGVVAAQGGTVSLVDAFAAIQPNHLAEDGVHLTGEGYSQLARVWYAAVHPLLTSLPAPTPTFTPTPAPTATPAPCSPRPPVMVTTRRLGDGRLAVTLAATGAGNGLREIRIGAARNAMIDVAGSAGTAGFSVTLAGSPASVTGTVTRLHAGEAVHVPLVALDQCGAWPTFVGGGPNAF
jgi:lysophospholipase L1-like esterase